MVSTGSTLQSNNKVGYASRLRKIDSTFVSVKSGMAGNSSLKCDCNNLLVASLNKGNISSYERKQSANDKNLGNTSNDASLLPNICSSHSRINHP